MERWSLSAELLAFILLLMTGLFCCDRKQTKTSVRWRIFRIGAHMAGAAIMLNLICVAALSHAEIVPLWVNKLLNSAYYLLCVYTCTVISAYLFDLMLDHVYDKSCRVRAVKGLSVFTVSYTLVVIVNYWTGWMFYFDENGMYQRGKIYQLGYFVVLMELFMLGMCYYRNRASVEYKVVNVMRKLPWVVALLIIFQLMFPGIMMNGMTSALVILTIFVNFQNGQAEWDSMTETGTRKGFYEEIVLRQKGRQKFQIITVSLKDFFVVNSRFGYNRGNEFLYHAARWLRDCRSECQVFRFGNVTFAMICPYVNDEESKKLIEEIQERFSQPWEIGDARCTLAACFGILTCNFCGPEIESTQVLELLTFMTDTVKKKEAGSVVFGSEMRQIFHRKKELQALLREAIDQNRLEVWYQPVYDCKERKYVSAEALVRMRKEDGSLVSPAEFIPLAEENGMIEEIGWFVWTEVCSFLGEHPELSLDNISVNMSVQQLLVPDLGDRMIACLKEHNVPIERTKLEITERVILYDTNYMERRIRELSDLGFQFCMDDFGTGYANFSTIMHLPFQCIKLDKSMCDDILMNQRSQMTVQAVIELFHNLGIQVNTEGIETGDQKEMVRGMGVDYIQGFYYARPMAKERLLMFLQEH